MRRKWGLAAVLLLLGGALSFAGGAPEAETTGFSTGEVVYLEGEIFINERAADFGAPVHSGDVVRTGTGSSCDIVFGEKNVMRLYEDTIAEIDFAGGEVRVETGSLGAVFEKLSNIVAAHGNKFQIASPQVVGGVRGTVFFLKIENPGSSYRCICYGKMTYEDTEGDNRRVAEAKNHKAFHYREVDGEIRSSSAKLLYHDDESMDAIAERVDVRIRWDDSDPSY